MLISRDGNVVTLINVFDTTPEHQQELVDQWVNFTEAMKDEPGLLGAALHKSTDGLRVINYAHWRSEAEFQQFLVKYRSQLPGLQQLAEQVDPHLYEVVYLHEK
jgi:quinol monooxygenase YgiN